MALIPTHCPFNCIQMHVITYTNWIVLVWWIINHLPSPPCQPFLLYSIAIANVTVWVKPWHIRIQTEINFIAPAYSYTKINIMHIHCLHWLMSTGLLFQNAFSDHVNPWLHGKVALMNSSNLAVHVGTWYGSHCWSTYEYVSSSSTTYRVNIKWGTAQSTWHVNFYICWFVHVQKRC